VLRHDGERVAELPVEPVQLAHHGGAITEELDRLQAVDRRHVREEQPAQPAAPIE